MNPIVEVEQARLSDSDREVGLFHSRAASPVAPTKTASRLTTALSALLIAGIAAIGVWQFSLKRPSATAQATDLVLTMPTGPAIAVLPFTNMSGDSSQEYFADGLTEDIITALSQFRDLFVIARNSTFQFKGKPVDVREVGVKLGAHYVLEGSVRRELARVRINAVLSQSLRPGERNPLL